MKKIFTLLSIVCAFAFMVACSSSPTSSPTAVAESFCKAMQNNDFEALIDLVYFSGGEEIAASKKSKYLAIMSEKGDTLANKDGGIKSYTIGEEQISEDGSEAKIRVEFENGNGKSDGTTLDCVCVDGTWYLEEGK